MTSGYVDDFGQGLSEPLEWMAAATDDNGLRVLTARQHDEALANGRAMPQG